MSSASVRSPPGPRAPASTEEATPCLCACHARVLCGHVYTAVVILPQFTWLHQVDALIQQVMSSSTSFSEWHSRLNGNSPVSEGCMSVDAGTQGPPVVGSIRRPCYRFSATTNILEYGRDLGFLCLCEIECTNWASADLQYEKRG